MRKCLVCFCLFILCFILIIIPIPLGAYDGIRFSNGQTIYVPAYSHIYSGVQGKPFSLTVTLSIRNIDPNYEIEITVVDYYQTKGTLQKRQLDQPVMLRPLDSIRFIIPERDKGGGSGANFIVEWESRKSVNPPIVESIMIGAKSQQGISFSSRGRAIMTSEQ